jgi:hypothetical protein
VWACVWGGTWGFVLLLWLRVFLCVRVCVCVCARVVFGVLWCVCVYGRMCVRVVCACEWCGVCVWCGVVCVFLKMKQHLAGKRHAAYALQHAVADRLGRLAADRYYMGISKLVSCYGKCLNVESDYMEMLVKVCATACIFVF